MKFASEYQNKLMKKYEQQNKDNLSKLDKLQQEGYIVTGMGTVTGPYTTHMSYFMSNGEILTVVNASSLHWAPMSLIY